MAIVPENRRLFAPMTVLENLQMGAYLHGGGTKEDFDRVYELFPLLHERRAQLAGTLSGGEQQMVAMGRALMSKPKLLLMDEPSMGLAPILVERSFEIIKQVHESGVAMLVVEQNANVSLSIADRGYVLSTGRLVLEGKAADAPRGRGPPQGLPRSLAVRWTADVVVANGRRDRASRRPRPVGSKLVVRRERRARGLGLRWLRRERRRPRRAGGARRRAAAAPDVRHHRRHGASASACRAAARSTSSSSRCRRGAAPGGRDVVLTVVAGDGVGEKLLDAGARARRRPPPRPQPRSMRACGEPRRSSPTSSGRRRGSSSTAPSTRPRRSAAPRSCSAGTTIVADARPRFATRERLPSADEILVAWPEEALEQVKPDLGTAVVAAHPRRQVRLPDAPRRRSRPTRSTSACSARAATRSAGGRCCSRTAWARPSSTAISGPSGLDIGAETPAETALSILGRDHRRPAPAARAGR